jgi:hypothetical protein
VFLRSHDPRKLYFLRAIFPNKNFLEHRRILGDGVSLHSLTIIPNKISELGFLIRFPNCRIKSKSMTSGVKLSQVDDKRGEALEVDDKRGEALHCRRPARFQCNRCIESALKKLSDVRLGTQL